MADKNTTEPVNFSNVADYGKFDLTKFKGSVIVSTEIDTHIKKGQSDAGGDHLHLAGVVRQGTPRNNWVIAGDASLDSSPRSDPEHVPISRLVGAFGAAHQRDTAAMAITVGRETSTTPHTDVGIYGKLGVLNGPAYDLMTSLKDKIHHLGGMAPGRKSPTSSGEELLAGVAGRLDEGVAKLGHGKLQAQLVGTAGLIVGTDKREALAAGYVWFGSNAGMLYHPVVPGMPAPDNRGSGVFAGIRAEAVQFDVATDSQGTCSKQLTSEIGAALESHGVQLTASLSHHGTPSVHEQTGPTTNTVRVGLTVRF